MVGYELEVCHCGEATAAGSQKGPNALMTEIKKKSIILEQFPAASSFSTFNSVCTKGMTLSELSFFWVPHTYE
jgi:hypothetical protein